MFPSLNPVAYIALGSIILNVGLLGYSFTVKTQLEASSARFQAFVAESDAKANAQIAENVKEVAKRDKITTELTKENEKLQSDLTAKYAEYRRMLNSKTRSGDMPTLPAAAQGIAKPEHEARLARALEQLEAGVISELAQSRDEAITQANLCAGWLKDQLAVE